MKEKGGQTSFDNGKSWSSNTKSCSHLPTRLARPLFFKVQNGGPVTGEIPSENLQHWLQVFAEGNVGRQFIFNKTKKKWF